MGWKDAWDVVSNAYESGKEAVSNAYENAKEAVSDALENAKSSANDAWNYAQSTATSVKNSVNSAVNNAQQAIESAYSWSNNAYNDYVAPKVESLKKEWTDFCNNLTGIFTPSGELSKYFDNSMNFISSDVNVMENVMDTIKAWEEKMQIAEQKAIKLISEINIPVVNVTISEGIGIAQNKVQETQNNIQNWVDSQEKELNTSWNSLINNAIELFDKILEKNKGNETIHTEVAEEVLETANNQATGKKSVEEIAREIIAGKWGNGQERVDMLTAEGYDSQEIQAKVNEILGILKSPQQETTGATSTKENLGSLENITIRAANEVKDYVKHVTKNDSQVTGASKGEPTISKPEDVNLNETKSNVETTISIQNDPNSTSDSQSQLQGAMDVTLTAAAIAGVAIGIGAPVAIPIAAATVATMGAAGVKNSLDQIDAEKRVQDAKNVKNSTFSGMRWRKSF